MAANSEVDMSTPFEREPLRDASRPECGLEEVIEVLREDVEPSAVWRDQLLRQLAAETTRVLYVKPRSIERRTWRVSPLVGIAAALAFMLLGSAGTMALQSRLVAVPDTSSAGLVSTAGVANVPNSEIGVRFAVMAAGAARVSLVGDFNGWDPAATPLRLASDGRTWVAMLPMRSGRHTYAFVIDGEVVADPSAPRAADDDFGTPSSLMLVSNAR